MDEPSTTQAPLGVLLGIVNQLYRTRMSVIAGRGDLTPTKLALLSHLSRHDGPVSIGELAEVLEINQPGVTKVVRRLAEDGLVTVEASAEDRRRRLVAVTATGLDRMGTTLALVSTDMATWFEGWSDDDLTSFTTQIDRLAAWLDANRLRPDGDPATPTLDRTPSD